ncbi:MAG: sulfotransferase [Pseudomonadota bacterium]
MIFIVGNSRSGTTMLGRVFGLNSHVHPFEELHFFEQMIDAKAASENPVWPRVKLVKLAERLLTSARDGLFADVVAGRYEGEAAQLVDSLEHPGPVSLYRTLLLALTHAAGKSVPLEQTPRYLFSAPEILAAFPQSHMINIVRDPRDVLTSQKNRWKRAQMTDAKVPLVWTVRSWTNYHPLTTSQLWNASVKMARKMEGHEHFHSLSYEALLADPETELRALCQKIELPYEDSILQDSQIGSSMGKDRPDVQGFDKSRIGSWKTGNLTAAEIALCEKIARDNMHRHGYELSGQRVNPVSQFALAATAPVKLAIAAAFNLQRFRNLPEILRRRFG